MFEESEPQEIIDMKYFTKFASYYPNIYTKYKETESGTFFDCLSQNQTGGTSLVELKERSTSTKNYTDLYIEPQKYVNLITLYSQYGLMPIYINFIGDEKDIWLWYLPQVSPLTPVHNINIKGKKQTRFALPKSQGHHFVYDPKTDKYIHHKPVEDVAPLNKAIKMDESIFDLPLNNKTFKRY